MTMSSIRHIENAKVEVPLESGVYAFVGNNGCGKSTLLLSLAQLISRHHLSILKKEDYNGDSYIQFDYEGKSDKWTEKRGWWTSNIYPKSIRFNGLYEGSLFYGTRFNDSRVIDNLLATGKIKEDDIVDSDSYVKQKLSFILHGDNSHYSGLMRIRNKHITSELGLSNAPYFNRVRGNLISQYRMSSGECLLISLLHFLYNSIVRKSLPIHKKVLVLIDEIELALHPIAVSRLIDLLNELVKGNSNLVVMLTTHSPEVIRKIKPSNLFKVNNENGSISIENNCYPSYLIRDVYSHDGFDYLLLVEDILTKFVVDKILNKESLKNSRLIHVVPVGGWSNVLSLHKELLTWNVLGLGKQIVSILDGDIKDEVGDEYKDIRKLFIPIKSIEKFLYEIIVEKPNPKIKKVLNDKYFTINSIDTLLGEHSMKYTSTPDHPEKKLYFRLKKDLEKRGITEEQFTHNLCDDLLELIDFSSFISSLTRLLTRK